MGLGLRGVRGIGAAEAVGVTEAPLEGGPELRGPTHSSQFRPAPHTYSNTLRMSIKVPSVWTNALNSSNI